VAFNNVLYDLSSSTPVGLFSVMNPNGIYYVFNNTIACGYSGAYTAVCENPSCPGGAIACYLGNNHLITSASPAYPPCSGVCSATTNQPQTDSAAVAQGYTDTETYARSPINSSGITYQSGTNRQAYCTSISSAGFAAAGLACQSDTAYGVSYNTSNHTVSPARGPISRPVGSTVWDAGAYQFQASSGSNPNPPVNLTATGH
jgi:hypothetical protein